MVLLCLRSINGPPPMYLLHCTLCRASRDTSIHRGVIKQSGEGRRLRRWEYSATAKEHHAASMRW